MVSEITFNGGVLCENDYLKRVKGSSNREEQFERVSLMVKVGPLHFFEDKSFLGLVWLNDEQVKNEDFIKDKYPILKKFKSGYKLLVSFDNGANYKQINNLYCSNKGIMVLCENYSEA